ncbi:MAG: pyridoxamine 5'-phosphate oxidase family protein [Firmicutes bacterium]|nr:pyridoxamine 5'-phosphate oxidase family protein [Bacillota bacterium]
MNRPTRRLDKIMSQPAAKKLLAAASVGRIGTVTPDGTPYVVPMHFVYTEGKVYLHSFPRGSKLENLAANPRVCFEVDEYLGVVPKDKACDYTTSYRSVVAFGRARVLDDPRRALDVLRLITAKYGPGAPPPSEQDLKGVVAIEITIDELTGKQSGLVQQPDQGEAGHGNHQ